MIDADGPQQDDTLQDCAEEQLKPEQEEESDFPDIGLSINYSNGGGSISVVKPESDSPSVGSNVNHTKISSPT